MKKVHIIARNHMDPSWLRCFTDHFSHPETGEIVRPYSDIEELQILEYMDFAERYGVKYQIEQSLVVRRFLERNPDQKARFRRLVRAGLLELAGGGEAVIDVNLTQGESWARNHLYSRTYYRKEFGHDPRYAITPDIFGLASQLPQFFRSIGYDALIIFDRVFKKNKPYWKGLDGTLLVLDSCFLQPPEPNLRTADCVKLPACPACRGEGCAFCEGTGIDTSYNMTRPDKELLQSAYYGNMSADVFLEKLLAVEKDEYFVMITTEEPPIGEHLYGPLKEAAARHGIEVDYLGFEENHDVWCGGYEEKLRSGRILPDEIDPRPDGNPAGAGCYSTRIEIKKANRELENLLFEAESLAVLARLSGGWKEGERPERPYPARKIEALWNKMAFLQFHDCVTGTHVDASYGELRRVIREVRRGALQVYADAAKEILRKKSFAVPEGRYAAAVFNPLPVPAEFPLLTLSAPSGTKSVRIFTPEGEEIPVFEPAVFPALAGAGLRMRVRARIPAFGWRVFFWEPAAAKEEAKAIPGEDGVFTLENEFFRIRADGSGVLDVFDKKQRRAILGKNAGGLSIGSDVGHPWGRVEPEKDHRPILPDRVSAETAPGYRRLTLSGVLADPERKVRKLSWSQTLTLFEGEDLIRWHTVLDWDGTDSRIFASFPPAFRHDGKLYTEVPFGVMARGEPEIVDCLGLTDEWPSLRFAGLAGDGTGFAVLKGGEAGTRIRGGTLEISLLRSITHDDPRYAGTSDVGRHESDYAVASFPGEFADGNAAEKAALFLAAGHTEEITGPGRWEDPAERRPPLEESEGGLLPALENLPAGLCLSALKWAEDGSGPVARFWESAGKEALLTLPAGVTMRKTNTLEDAEGKEPVSAYAFRPFEIATFRLSGLEKGDPDR